MRHNAPGGVGRKLVIFGLGYCGTRLARTLLARDEGWTVSKLCHRGWLYV